MKENSPDTDSINSGCDVRFTYVNSARSKCVNDVHDSVTRKSLISYLFSFFCLVSFLLTSTFFSYYYYVPSSLSIDKCTTHLQSISSFFSLLRIAYFHIWLSEFFFVLGWEIYVCVSIFYRFHLHQLFLTRSISRHSFSFFRFLFVRSNKINIWNDFHFYG